MDETPPPEVMERTPVPSASGWWASVGAFLGFLLEALPILEPLLPPEWRKPLPVIGALVGLVLNRWFRPSWRVARRGPPPGF